MSAGLCAQSGASGELAPAILPGGLRVGWELGVLNVSARDSAIDLRVSRNRAWAPIGPHYGHIFQPDKTSQGLLPVDIHTALSFG